jgi:hypothetical protein
MLVTTSIALPLSRSAAVSPTQMIGVIAGTKRCSGLRSDNFARFTMVRAAL